MALILIGTAILALSLGCWVTFSRLVRARKRVDEAWRNLEDCLEARHELLGPLVEGTRGNREFERSIMEIVSTFRVMCADGSEDIGSGETRFSKQLKEVILLTTKFPDLDTIGAFDQFKRELVKVEGMIKASTKKYNSCVKEYNDMLHSFPTSTVAKKIDYRTEKLFDMQFTLGVR